MQLSNCFPVSTTTERPLADERSHLLLIPHGRTVAASSFLYCVLLSIKGPSFLAIYSYLVSSERKK